MGRYNPDNMTSNSYGGSWSYDHMASFSDYRSIFIVKSEVLRQEYYKSDYISLDKVPIAASDDMPVQDVSIILDVDDIRGSRTVKNQFGQGRDGGEINVRRNIDVRVQGIDNDGNEVTKKMPLSDVIDLMRERFMEDNPYRAHEFDKVIVGGDKKEQALYGKDYSKEEEQSFDDLSKVDFGSVSEVVEKIDELSSKSDNELVSDYEGDSVVSRVNASPASKAHMARLERESSVKFKDLSIKGDNSALLVVDGEIDTYLKNINVDNVPVILDGVQQNVSISIDRSDIDTFDRVYSFFNTTNDVYLDGSCPVEVSFIDNSGNQSVANLTLSELNEGIMAFYEKNIYYELGDEVKVEVVEPRNEGKDEEEVVSDVEEETEGKSLETDDLDEASESVIVEEESGKNSDSVVEEDVSDSSGNVVFETSNFCRDPKDPFGSMRIDVPICASRLSDNIEVVGISVKRSDIVGVVNNEDGSRSVSLSPDAEVVVSSSFGDVKTTVDKVNDAYSVAKEVHVEKSSKDVSKLNYSELSAGAEKDDFGIR